MPICSWCGIESKNDLVCDWCKRPLALRASRKMGVDLLREDTETVESTWTPRVIAITAIISLCLIGIVVWAYVTSRHEDVATTVPPVSPASTQQRIQVTSIGAKATEASGPPARMATPVFLSTPPPQGRNAVQPMASDYTPLPTQGPKVSRSTARHLDYTTIASGMYDADNQSPEATSVRLTSGLLRYDSRTGTVYGRVGIINTGEHKVVEFRLETDIKGQTYSLDPYEGTLEAPEPVTQFLIDAGQKVSLPVKISRRIEGGRDSGIINAPVSMEAFLDFGSRDVIKDEILTP